MVPDDAEQRPPAFPHKAPTNPTEPSEGFQSHARTFLHDRSTTDVLELRSKPLVALFISLATDEKSMLDFVFRGN